MTTETLSDVQSGAESPAAVRKTGAVILVRHGEPALSRKVMLTSAGYRDWWARYEIGGLLEGQVPPECLVESVKRAGAVYSSTRPRSIETAAAAAGDRLVPPDALFIEAPLPPPRFPSFIKLSPRWWGVVARFWWWFFDHHEGQENKAQALVRAREAADRLERDAATGQDVVVMAHGFFNGMIGVELTKRGWRCVRDKGFQYWSARHFEKR